MPTPNEPEGRNSGLTDPQLVQDGRDLLVAMRRDVNDFINDGVDAERLDKLESDLNDFEQLPSDVVDEATQAAETQVRDAAVNTLQDTLRAVAGPVIDVFGLQSPQYRSLGILDLEKMSDADLLRAAIDCHASGTRQLANPAVVQEGLTATKLAAIGPAREALVTVLTQRTALVEQRALNAQTRVRTHNTLNDTITTLRGKGQRKYRLSDPARYDDYVRQPAPAPGTGGGTPPEPPK